VIITCRPARGGFSTTRGPPARAHRHEGIRAARQFARARWCDCSTARWSHASPPLSAQPAGDTSGGARSAAGQLGVAVVITRSHEYDDCSTPRRPRLVCVSFAQDLVVRLLDRTLVSLLSGHASPVRSAGWRYERRCPQCSRSAWRRSRDHKITRVQLYDDCSTARRSRIEAVCASSLVRLLGRTLVSRLSGDVPLARVAGLSYGRRSTVHTVLTLNVQVRP
jgi:hypothetical protein